MAENNKHPLISLCIPTNGISEWVFPVLDAIYNQNVSEELYEIVVTDNGNNSDFEKEIQNYISSHKNLIYKKTTSILFQNQIDSLKLAHGLFLKFVNHRAIFNDGALQWMIDQIDKYKETKPIIYFSNGVLSGKHLEYDSFDLFVNGLGKYVSWTTGVGVWKSDFELIPENHIYNKISPHSDVLLFVRDRQKYIIDDYVWSHSIDSKNQKGSYDLYKCFACEELCITLSLYLEGSISAKTFKNVKKSYLYLLIDSYQKFNILKFPCSYELNGFNDSMGIFFSKAKIIFISYFKLPQFLFNHYIRKNKKIYNIITKLLKKAKNDIS